MSPTNCLELIDALNRSKTLEDVHEACAALCEQSDFDCFLYGARIPTSLVNPHFIFVHCYPDEWRARYVEQNYMRIDPTVSHCERHLTPLPWHEINSRIPPTTRAKAFMGEASEFGLKSGISVPVHNLQGDFAMLNLASNDEHPTTNTRILNATPSTQLFAVHLHETVKKIFERELPPGTKVELTQREKECLLWSAEGKTSWETSQILDVSERTVIFHIQNAANRLQVANRPHAVARAITLGLITPQLG